MADLNITLFLNRPKNILNFFGIWPLENLRWHQLILHRIYTFLVLASQYSFLFFEFIYIASVLGDLDEVSESSFLLFTQASLCYKTTVFLANKKKLYVLLDFMKDELFAPQNKLHQRRIVSHARTIKRLCLFFSVSAVSTCSLWGLIPLFDSNGRRIFPFKIWMPIGPEHSPQYELGYLYQMLAIYISALLFIAVDSVTVCMIMFGCAQLEIIGDKLNTLQNVSLPKLRQNQRNRIMEQNNETFEKCIKHHQAVVRYIEIVEDTYHANIFFQLSGTAAIICIIGLRISVVDRHSIQFISMINYMVTMLSQLFLYCWCGQELTIRSELLRERLYLCPWYEQDMKFRRSLWIVMERMKRPIIFRAGHYIPLSRPTFVSVLRSSYSYFAVLNQANSK